MSTKILITGANSYVGTNVEIWLLKEPNKYQVETLDMINSSWKEFDFSKFDIVFHVAGIAHIKNKRSMKNTYYKVNRDLAIETAQHSKNAGVKLFIFMSSITIYGKDNKVGKYNSVDVNEFKPTNAYSRSKLDADLKIQELESEDFRIAIIRTPVIYGPHSKGNFAKLQELSHKTPIFPKLKNIKSMIYIDNFSEFIKLIISNLDSGVFYPQNKDYVSTINIVKGTRAFYNKKLYLCKLINPVIYCLRFLSIINKVFGNKYYDQSISKHYEGRYQVVSFQDSIRITCSHKLR